MPDSRQAPDEEPAPLLWRSLPLRLALAALPLWMTVAVLLANVVWPTRLVLAVTLGLSYASPVYGLLLVALLAPLGQLIAPAVSDPGFRIGEAIVVAFLAGWLARALPDRRGPRVPAPSAAGLLAVTIAASIAGLAWQLRGYSGELAAAFNQLRHAYFFVVDRTGVVDGAQLIEGIGLSAATVMLFRRRPALAATLPIALAASATVAALSSVLLWRGIGWAPALARYKLIGYRVSGHVGDVNAAGSYFAMIACLALGMAAYRRGRERALWIGFAAASGVGLWFSETRSAYGAAGAGITIGLLWAGTSRFGRRARATMLTLAVIALFGGGLLRARLLETDPTYRGGGFREQFIQTSARMMTERPWFGVGIGQYQRMSALFLSPQLAFSYGFEHAHNYVLQIGGELGLVGLCAFAAWIGAALARAARALARAPRDGRLLGVAGGVTVFLVTCLSGHPLLVGEVAYPFWIQLGLMTALAGSTLLNDDAGASAPDRPGASRTASRLAAAAAMVIAVSSPIVAARSAMVPSDSQAVNGCYQWETLEDGSRFRWTGAYASLFVPNDVTRVEIPVRVPTDGRHLSSMGVEVMIGGVDRGRTIVDSTWTIIDLPLPGAAPPTRFTRIDLRMDRTWQPGVYIAGSADLRRVGVQLGEPRVFRR